MQPINTAIFPAIAAGFIGNGSQEAPVAGGKGAGIPIKTPASLTVTPPITDIIGGIPGITPVSDGGVPIGVWKGAGNVVNAQPLHQQAPTLMSATSGNRAGQPYEYGNLDLSTSAYNIWGSRGNPYIVAGPTYTPGSGSPIIPQPIARPTTPINYSSDSEPVPDWVDPNSPEAQAKSYGDLQSWLGRDRNITRGVTGVLGMPLLDPAVDFMYGINPFTQQSLSWYDGSTDDFNYVGTDEALEGRDYSAAMEAYMQDFMNDMTDLDQDEYVQQYMEERGWWGTKGFADPNDPLAVEANQIYNAQQEQIAADIRAEAEAKEAQAKAEAAAQQQQLDLMYNKFTGYTDKQLQGVTASINNDIANVTAQIAANQGSTQEELNQLAALQDQLYDLTETQVESLSAQINNLGVSTQQQYEQLDAAQQNQYNTLFDQLEAVEGELAWQSGGWTDSDYGNNDFNNQSFGTSEADLGGLPTTVQDAYDEETYYQQTGEYNNVTPQEPVIYGHPEVVTPIEYSDYDTGGVTDSGGYEDSSTGESFSASDFSEGGNMSDWGSAEEYADDFGFDDDGWDDASSDSGGGDSGGGGGGSYIATAATQALGEEGLKVFEDWRDYMFKALPTFTSSFGRYRVTAPKIVKAIDKKENSKELYKEIWDKHLNPIFKLIKEDPDNPKALSDYKSMVKELMNKYIKTGDK